ncbi:MAG: Ig-like domain-containing protein [Rhodobacter sp.]|nr:Ig-like domain-containing protein [Rhodobacter sp.]
MSTVGYVVRDTAGSARRGTFPEGDPSSIYVSYTKDVSLNLGQADIAGYQRLGSDLVITLDNGQVVVLNGYFDTAHTGAKGLFLSQQGEIVEVVLADGDGAAMVARYQAVEVGGEKWSPYDQLVFLDLAEVEPVVAPLVAPLASQLGGLLAGGAAIAGGLAVAGGGDGDGGGGAKTVIQPTVDDPDATHLIGGTVADSATVSGTGAPGSEVVVDIGGETQTVTVADDGTWVATFDTAGLPGDGIHEATVAVVDPDDNSFDLDGPTFDIDFTAPTVTVLSGTQSTGDLVNAAGHADGATITGTGEAGATVAVTIAGTTHTTTVADNGAWSVTFATAEIEAGEYTSEITLVTTDARGNSTTSTDVLVVDTVAPTADLDPVEGDDVVNAGEASDGVTLSGSGEAGAEIVVEFQGLTRTTTVGVDGTWSLDYSAAEIAPGTYDSTVTITTTDAAGNSSVSTHTVHIDTEQALTLNAEVGGDYVINAAEQSAGVTFTGTAEAGSIVVVTLGAVSHTVTADATGNWSADFAPGDIPTGSYDTTVTAVATDNAGNSETSTQSVRVDTEHSVALDNAQAGDNVISGAEAAAGVAITGTAEPGATVAVTMQGVTHTVTATDAGTFSAPFAPSEIPPGEYVADIQVSSTDTAGNTATARGSVRVDTETSVSIAPDHAGGDSIVNAAEAAAGVTFTGMAEPGASVAVTVAGVTHAATVDPSGAWSALFAAGTIPAGEYDTTVSVVSTDAVGNTATASSAVRVDTAAGEVAISPLPIEIDDIINAAERADGVVINGTATPGLTVTVTLGDASQQVVADPGGNWTVTVPAADIPTGTQTLPITASITDAAGNSATATDSVGLDTVVDSYSLDAGPIEGDDIINEAERADGVTLTGTVEPGSTVVVELAGGTQPATVDGAGNWSVTFPAASIPQGSYTTDVVVTATDLAGNTDVLTDTVQVDTEALLTSNPNQTDDDVINAAERLGGVALSGTAEPGASVVVELLGVTRTATVDAAGNWAAEFTADELPEGTYAATATITATDPAGNTATLTESFNVDTEITSPNVDSVTFAGSDVWRVGTQDAEGSYAVNTLEPGGAVGTPSSTVTQHPVLGTEFTFTSAVPDGTNLVVSRVDDAGNSSATLVVLEDGAGAASTVSHAGLTGFDIQALNLDYGENTDLVLTEAQIKALSNSSDTLTIHGGADDTVTVSGAVNTGQTQDIGGQTYNVYTLGNDGATLVIEQDITVVI